MHIPPLSLSPLDYGVLYAILCTVLLSSMFLALRSKNSSLKSYALGTKKLTSIPLVFAILAVSCGGEQLSIIDTIARDGIIMAVVYAFWSLEFLFGALYLAPRIADFEGCLTKGDILTKCYGKKAGMFSGLVWALAGPIGISIQYLAIGRIVSTMLSTPVFETTLVLGVLITCYAILGEGRTMALTGMIQLVVLAAALFLLIGVLAIKEGGISSLIRKVPQAKLALWNHPKFWYYMVILWVWEIFPQSITSTAVVQQLLMTKEEKQIRKAMLGLAAFCVGFAAVLAFLGLTGSTVLPGPPTQGIFYELVTRYLPHGMQGLVLAGVILLIISGRDFRLHALSLAIIRSLVKPWALSQNIVLQEVNVIKLTSFVLGVSAAVIAPYCTEFIRILGLTIGLATPLTTIPFLGAILFRKVKAVSYRNAAIATLVAMAVCQVCVPSSIAYIIPLITLSSSILGYSLTHFLTKDAKAVRTT